MILSKRLLLKSDNSVIGDINRKNIIISDRPFQPSNITGAENIVEGFDNIVDIIKLYKTVDHYIQNVIDREMDYTLLCNPPSYAHIFSSFLKSYYPTITKESAYIWYVYNTQYDNLLSYQLDQQFKLQGLEGFAILTPFDLQMNDPLELEAFAEIFNTASPFSFSRNTPYTSLGLEHHLLLYGNDKDKALYTPTIVRKRVLTYITNTLLSLKKDILLYLYPQAFTKEWSCKIHEIDYLQENEKYGYLFKDDFTIKNIQSIIDTYPHQQLLSTLIEIKEELGYTAFLDKELLPILSQQDDTLLMDFIIEHPKYLIVDNHFVYKVNPLWIYRITNELKNHNTSFFNQYQLKRG